MKQKIEFNLETTLAQQCFERLQEDIVEGILKPGEKLKIEPLKEKLGVGQSPIREALSRLVSIGLVEATDNKGFYVASISEENIRDIYATFTLIENAALKLAIEKGDDNWKTNVVTELYKLSLIEEKEEPVSYSEWAAQNYKFHQALISGCKSPTLLEIQNNLYLKFDRYVRMAYRMTPKSASINHDERKKDDHKRLADFALNRDIKNAVELMTYHINGPFEDVVKILKSKKMI